MDFPSFHLQEQKDLHCFNLVQGSSISSCKCQSFSLCFFSLCWASCMPWNDVQQNHAGTICEIDLETCKLAQKAHTKVTVTTLVVSLWELAISQCFLTLYLTYFSSLGFSISADHHILFHPASRSKLSLSWGRMSNMSISYFYFLLKKQLWLVFAIQINGLCSLSLSFSVILIKNWYLKIYLYNWLAFLHCRDQNLPGCHIQRVYLKYS